MKNQIIINSGVNELNFYLSNQYGTYYLFTQPYTPGVYDYFRSGRSENEIRSFRNWNRNPRLDKTIEKLPMYIRFVMREYVMEDMEAERARRVCRSTRASREERWEAYEGREAA